MKTRPTAQLLQTLCALLAFAGFDINPVRADLPDASYAQELARRADELELHRQPQWLALLHYRARPLRATRSTAQTERFFASKDGATDARAELEATLASFFEATPRDGEDIPRRCAYPARYRWLDLRLGFDAARMPAFPCPNFERWLAETRGPKLSLIFPEAFMNNPASMFGHTLLRVERADSAGDGLLGYALDFSGQVGNDGVMFQIVGGTFGLYPGSFGVNPYYEKLKKYAEWEYRDVWEYELDFSPAEVDLLLRHVWELRGISFPYYFFDDNCSYQLLRLLRVVRPQAEIDEGFPLYVLPADTVRVLVAAGWVGDVHYRPSPATHLKEGVGELSPSARRLARRVAIGATAPDAAELAELAPRERAIVLSIAYESLRYDFLSGLSGEASDAQSRSRARAMLVARSQLGRNVRGDPLRDIVLTPAVRPDRGHATARASVAGGVRDGRGFVELRVRASLHDLMDPVGGYSRESQIQVLDTRVRYLPGRRRTRLEQLTLLDIVSLAPRDAFFRQLAWKTKTGLRTRLVKNRKPDGSSQLDPEPVWNTNAGVGLATALGTRIVAYGFGELTLDVGPGLDDSVSFGPGATLGLYADGFGDRYRANLEGSVVRFTAGHVASRYRTGIRQRLTLSRRSALVALVEWDRSEGKSWLEGSLSLHIYF